MQSKLDIKVDDYENESNIPKYEYIDKSFSYHKYKEPLVKIDNDWLIISKCVFVFRIYYLLVYYYYGVMFYFNSEDENIEKISNTIIKIEKYSFAILFFNILYFILMNYIFTYEFPKQFNIIDIRLYLISLSLLIICLSYIIFFAFCIYRFILFFIIYNFIHPLIIIVELFFYRK